MDLKNSNAAQTTETYNKEVIEEAMKRISLFLKSKYLK